MAAPTNDPLIIATSDVVLPSGSNNKKEPDSSVLVNGYGIEALPLNDYNYTINNHGKWLSYFKDEIIPSIDVTNWNLTSTLLADAANITPSGTYPDQDQNFQAIVEQGAGRAQKTVNNGTSGVTVKVTYPVDQEAPQSYYDGMKLVIDVGGSFSGGTTCTLELDSLGAKTLYSKYGGGGVINRASMIVPKGVFNSPTVVYYNSTIDAFIVESTVEDRNFLFDEAIDIVTSTSLLNTSLGGVGDITLSYITGGTFNYGKLYNTGVNYGAVYNVGDVLDITGLQTFVTVGATTLTLSGTYQIQSFTDGGNGMLLQDYNGGSGGDVEDVDTDWTLVPTSTGLNTDNEVLGSLTASNIVIPYSLTWTDFERIEVITKPSNVSTMSGNCGIGLRDLLVTHPTTFTIRVASLASTYVDLQAISNNACSITESGAYIVSVKGYLRRSFV